MVEDNRNHRDRGSYPSGDHGHSNRRSGARCGDGRSGDWYGCDDPMRPGYSIPVIGPRASLTVGFFAVLSLILMGAL